MKEKRTKLKISNPNRFNGLDSAIFYIILLLTFTIGSAIISKLFGNFFRLILEFDVYAYMCVSTFISQAMIFGVAVLYSLIRKVQPVKTGGYIVKWDAIQVLMSIILSIGVMMLFYFTHYQLSEYFHCP